MMIVLSLDKLSLGFSLSSECVECDSTSYDFKTITLGRFLSSDSVWDVVSY